MNGQLERTATAELTGSLSAILVETQKLIRCLDKRDLEYDAKARAYMSAAAQASWELKQSIIENGTLNVDNYRRFRAQLPQLLGREYKKVADSLGLHI